MKQLAGHKSVYMALGLAAILGPLVVAFEWMASRTVPMELLLHGSRAGLLYPLKIIVILVFSFLAGSFFVNQRRPVFSTRAIWLTAIIGWLLLGFQVWPKASALTFSWLDMKAILGSREVFASYASFALGIVSLPFIANLPDPAWLRQRWWLVPTILAVCSAAAYGWLLYLKWVTISLAARDVGIFDQAVWHLSRLESPASTIRGYTNLWADHFHPILLLLAPLYWLHSSPYILYGFQILVVALGVFPAYALARRATKSELFATGVAISYGFYGGLQHGMNFGFYPEILSVSFVLWMIWSLAEKRLLGVWIFFVLALATKEDTGLALLILGLLIGIRPQWRRLGFTMAAASFLWVLVSLKMIIPHFIGSSTYQYWSYDAIGANPKEFIVNALVHPLHVVTVLTHPSQKLYTMLHTFGDFGFLPLLSPVIVAGTNYLAENFLSSRNQLWVYGFHYQVMILPYLVLSTVVVGRFLQRRWDHAASVLGVMLIVNSLLASYLGNYPLYILARQPSDGLEQRVAHNSVRQLLATIPSNVSVTASGSLAAELAHRSNIYDYPNNTNESQYLVLSASLNSFPIPSAQLAEDIALFRTSSTWEVVGEAAGTVVFRRKSNQY